MRLFLALALMMLSTSSAWACQAFDDALAELEAVVVSDAGDADHDGIADAQDNCPAVFNPRQDDQNQNMIGDACE